MKGFSLEVHDLGGGKFVGSWILFDSGRVAQGFTPPASLSGVLDELSRKMADLRWQLAQWSGEIGPAVSR